MLFQKLVWNEYLIHIRIYCCQMLHKYINITVSVLVSGTYCEDLLASIRKWGRLQLTPQLCIRMFLLVLLRPTLSLCPTGKIS